MLLTQNTNNPANVNVIESFVIPAFRDPKWPNPILAAIMQALCQK